MNGDPTPDGEKITKPRLTLLVVVVSATSILVVIAYILLKPDYQSAAQATQAAPVEKKKILPVVPEKPKPGLPVRLVIAGINVDVQVGQLGLTKNGDMAVPTTITDTGWYKYGPHPGDTGTAVIVGHLNGRKGEPGIFRNLEKLQKGDILVVVDDKGEAISFTVREVRSYGYKEEPSEVFTSNGGVHLNLITCTGTWIKAEHSFTKRLVVFSDRSD